MSFCPQWVAQHCASSQSSGFYRLLWSSSHQSLTELLLVLLKVEHSIILLCYFTNDYKCTFLPAGCKNTLSEWYLLICGHRHSIWSDIKTSVWFWFTSPLWLVTLSTLSYTHLQSVYVFFWEISLKITFHLKFLCHWVFWAPIVVWVLFSCCLYILIFKIEHV